MVIWMEVDILEGMEGKKKKEDGNFRLRKKGQKIGQKFQVTLYLGDQWSSLEIKLSQT